MESLFVVMSVIWVALGSSHQTGTASSFVVSVMSRHIWITAVRRSSQALVVRIAIRRSGHTVVVRVHIVTVAIRGSEQAFVSLRIRISTVRRTKQAEVIRIAVGRSRHAAVVLVEISGHFPMVSIHIVTVAIRRSEQALVSLGIRIAAVWGTKQALVVRIAIGRSGHATVIVKIRGHFFVMSIHIVTVAFRGSE